MVFFTARWTSGSLISLTISLEKPRYLWCSNEVKSFRSYALNTVRFLILPTEPFDGGVRMPRPKVTAFDYMTFLIAAQRVYTCTEAAPALTLAGTPVSHDCFLRVLQKQPPDTAALWHEAKQ